LIYYLTMKPKLKQKLLDEIMPKLKKASHDFMNELTYEVADDFEYTKMCYNESLRLEPPVALTTGGIMTKDVQLGACLMKKGDSFYISNEMIQRDPKHWQDPEEFIPDRFDPKSKYFKAPGGGPRHPLAFVPFLGGKRICLGKSLAEVMTRFTVPLLFYHFDFEFSNPEQAVKKVRFALGGSESPVFPFVLVNKNEVKPVQPLKV